MWRRGKNQRPDLVSKPPSSPPPSTSGNETESSTGQVLRQFTIAELRSATQDFNKGLLLGGEGAFSNWYKGTIGDGKGILVAVKRLSYASQGSALEFQAGLDIHSMFRHPNIVCLFGYCNDGREMYLVYEYMPNGTLYEHLHIRHTSLSWSQRVKICIDAARALKYLHDGTSGQDVIHNDVKSSAILLDSQWAAKITYFGSKTNPIDNPSSPVSSAFVGTFGYFDPDYILTGRLSKKSDVYSFGVVLLEVLCRRRALDSSLDEEQRGLVGWAQDYMKTGDIEQIIDPDLKGQISLKCLNDYARVVECCLRERQQPRITMAEVAFGLESVLALQERIDNSVPQMGITTSDWRLQKHFFSSEQNSGGSYFRKDTELLSAKSRQHEGDRGAHMPEKDYDVMSNISYALGMSPKRSIRFTGEDSDSASEPDHEAIDQEFRELLSGDKPTESLYELTQLEYIQQADGLMRMIDFINLIWFYPVEKEAEVNFGSLLEKLSSLNECIGKLENYSMDEDCLMEIQTLLQDIQEDLDDVAFDMVAYLAEDNSPGSVGFENQATGANSGQYPFASFWSGISEVHASAISSATHRAISCIKDLKVKKLGISGSDAEELADILKDMPELRRVFYVVLCVRVKNNSIEELMNDIEEEILRETGNSITVHDKFPNCLLFVDCSDAYIDLHDPQFNLSRWFGSVQIVVTSGSQNAFAPVDILIRVEDHLLPWILFSMNADLKPVSKDSTIPIWARVLIEKCHGHLLAIILLARALRGVVDVSVWEIALHELTSQKELSSSPLGVTISDVMVGVLRFIWSRMETMCQRCIIQFASCYIGTNIKKSSLINSWTKDGSIKGEQEGEHVFEEVIRSFLIEQVGENCVRMRNEIRVILLTYFVPPGYGLHPKQDGSELNKIPNLEDSDAWEIHLSNNIISELPINPNFPLLVNLFLHNNQNLSDIPITFFDNMPSLEVLDLSRTSITCFPPSILKLTSLRKLFIRDCDLLMELPTEIGALKNLKVFDSEGTELICLPKQFGSLAKLESLKFSLHNSADKHKRSNQTMQIIPATVFSKLTRLQELSIYVDLYGEWWEDEIKSIIDNLPKVRNLKSLRLYFPTTKQLAIFMGTKNWRGVPIYQHLSNFGFIVGHLQERLIYRVPLDLNKIFVKMPKCLTYTNGEGDTELIGSALSVANAFFLDRHWTAQSLSAFGLAQMEWLKICLLAECNEMLEIVNGSHVDHLSIGTLLESLEYLSIHYMKSLTCILDRPLDRVCLPNLKTLTIHSCPNLRTIFTQGLLDSLTCLEYLVVEDCAKIKNLVSLESDHSTSIPCLRSLKKISLLHLPVLVSISHGTSIAPKLESLVVYNCPNLEELSYMEATGDLKEIKGENEWWDALKWCEPEWTSGQPDYLARAFIPLGTHGDIMDELDDAVNLIPHLGIGESTKGAQIVQVITRPGPTDKRKGKF